ncbi:unnamed protein product [Symbiodinium sp. KB8]|nr:unnamed protein product [Symbiodinium sp. KB8]
MLCNNMLGMLGSEKFSLAMAVSARPCVVRSMHTGNCEHGLYDMSAYVPGGWHGEGTRPQGLNEDTRSSSPLEITQELTGAASLSQAMKSAGAEGEKATSLPQRPKVDESLPAGLIPDLPGSAKQLPEIWCRPRSHLLVELLRYEDFYHASPTPPRRLQGVGV